MQVEVLSVDAVKYEAGHAGGIHSLGRGSSVARVGPSSGTSGLHEIFALGVEEQRVSVIADITSPEDQWQRLGDGYSVAVLILWQDDRVLQTPTSALFRNGDQWYVFIVKIPWRADGPFRSAIAACWPQRSSHFS